MRSERQKRRERFAEKQQKLRDHLESHTNNQVEEVAVDTAQSEVQGDTEDVETQEMTDDHLEGRNASAENTDENKETTQPKKGVANNNEGQQGFEFDTTPAEEYARATLALKDAMNEKIV